MEEIRRKYYKSRDAKIHFIIFSVVIVVLLLVIPIVTVLLLSSAFDEQIRHETVKSSNAIRRTVRTFIDGAYNLSYELSVNPSILSMDPVIQKHLLQNSARRNPYMELLYVTGIDGMQTARSSGELGDRSGRWWFLQMMETKLPFVSKSYFSIHTAMPCTSIYIPIWDDTRMIAIFGVDIRLDYFQSLVEQFTSVENGQFAFVIDGDGVVIAHHDRYILETLTNYRTMMRTVPVLDINGDAILNEDGSPMTVEEEFTATNEYRNVIYSVMNGDSGLELVNYNDAVYYMSYEPIMLPGYSDSWSIITLYDRDVAMGVISRLVIQEIIFVAVILIIFIILIVTLFRSLSKTMNYLENATAEADQANKSKSRFLATMSHEIRTPLNAIIGLTQVQLQQKNLPEENLEALEKIYISGNSLLKIINDILDLSKVETGILNLVPEEYDMPSLINDTVHLNIVRIGDKKIKFILEVDESLPFHILGDSLRVKQILNNLISNAIKYTHEGFVKLTVSHTINENDVTLCFRVEDTGVGVTYEDQQRMFSEYTRFSTHDNMYTEGTGLGLTITKKLAHMMGGEIIFESVSGEGSVFTVTIMQKTVDGKTIGSDIAERLMRFTFFTDTDALSKIDYAQLPHGSVLVVDDVDVNLFVAEAVLKPYNLSIDLVTSGLAAIEKVRNGGRYDIIFMDHMMPDMDGVEATEKLRDLGYTGAIIALTANALVGNEEIFTQHGFDGFMPKPIDIHDLDEVINKYIDNQ